MGGLARIAPSSGLSSPGQPTLLFNEPELQERL